ncbi:MAG TPA: hypothetical protein VMF63_10915 [Opitutaceae bacterium]|nr:hypothetical protein [Opitutaceae bacterium]
MAKLPLKWLALVGSAALTASGLFAQDNSKALLDLLVQKGILSPDDIKQVQAEAKKSAATSSTTVSGKLYVDVTNLDAETAAGTKLASSGTGLDVKRFYFGVTHVFDSMWSANINTDSAYSSTTGVTNLFIKTAYVQAKFSPEAIVQLGSANEPWIPFDEDNYTYRYVENTLIDRLHFGNSADWGVHFLGSSGMVSYNFAAVNGGGYKNPTRSKGMDYEGRVSIEPTKGLTFAVGGYTGKLGKDIEGAPANRTASRYDALVNYATKEYEFGAEWFSESDWGFTNSASSDSGDGYALFGKVALGDSSNWLFGRWDNDKTSKKLHPLMKENYFNLGWEYVAIKGVNLALVYKYDHIENPASASAMQKSNEIGLWAQVAF